jgi:bifunctional non-homologous end joining protein LigD
MGRQVSLYYREGSSDKVYHIQLVDCADGMAEVNFQYGRRGNTLQHGSKTNGPTALRIANQIFDKLMAEKQGKGYRGNEVPSTSIAVVETTVEISSGKTTKKLTTIPVPEQPEAKKVILAPQLLNVIDEAMVQLLIEDDDYMAQEKKDGHRRLALTDPTITGLNKKGEAVMLVESIVKSLPKGMALAVDGEQIGDKLFVFDLLMRDKRSLREVDAIRRHQILSSIEFGKDINVVYNAVTTKEKRALYERLKAENKEGIVFKRKTSAYKSGRPNSGGDQLKFQFRKRASFIVDSITKGKRSIGVIVFENDTRIPIGKCTIPPNHDMPKVGEVVEIQYLHAFKGGAIYQPVYFGKRDDVDAHECLIKQIVFKPEEADTEE